MILQNSVTSQQLHLIFMRSIQAAQVSYLGILQMRQSKYHTIALMNMPKITKASIQVQKTLM